MDNHWRQLVSQMGAAGRWNGRAALRILAVLALSAGLALPGLSVQAADAPAAGKPDGPPVAGVLAPGVNQVVYVGTMTTSVEVRNMYLQPVEVVTRSYPVMVLVQPPLVDSLGRRESNPFRLIVARDPNTGNVQEMAEISLWSSVAYSEPSEPGLRILMQYWNYSLEGDTFSGVLTDSHKREGLVLNQVISRAELGPYNWMSCLGHMIGQDEGGSPSAVMVGNIRREQIAIRVDGYGGYCGVSFAPFVSVIVAERQFPLVELHLPLVRRN